MGYSLDIDAFVHIKRTEEQKKALEEEIKKLENEADVSGNVVSYNVETKKRVYESDRDLEDLKSQPKEYFVHSDDMRFESKSDTFIVINAIKEFYGLNFPCYKYEGISLEDLKSIIALLKPRCNDEDEEEVEYVGNTLSKFVDGIIEDLEYNKIDQSRILDFKFSFTLS